MKFSVTIPAYKATYLKECIESILAQTYTDFELIIVNDASPEDLTSIVHSFNDPRIRYYINEKNCGAINVVDNWNKCLEHSTGDYIICMGDDDKLLPTCLEDYSKLINKYPGLGVYHAWTQIINEHSEIIRMVDPRPEYESIYSFMLSRWNGREQFIGDFLFDRKELFSVGGFYKLPLAWASDDISVFIAAEKSGIANMQKPGFQYRINSETISKNGNVGLKLKAINGLYEWTYNFLVDKPNDKNSIDYIYWKILVEKLDNMIFKYKIYTLSVEITHNLFKSINYFLFFKKYSLSFKIVMLAFLIACKNRLKAIL